MFNVRAVDRRQFESGFACVSHHALWYVLTSQMALVPLFDRFPGVSDDASMTSQPLFRCLLAESSNVVPANLSLLVCIRINIHKLERILIDHVLRPNLVLVPANLIVEDHFAIPFP